jgi:cytochrome c556
MMMKRAIWLCALSAGLVATAGPLAGPPQADTSKVMRLKLDYAQAILRSIVLEDFAQLERQSRELAKLTDTAGWQVLQTTEYKQHSAEFLRIAESLTEAAQQRNADAAALDYVGLTLQCVHCHKHVRGARLAFHVPNVP